MYRLRASLALTFFSLLMAAHAAEACQLVCVTTNTLYDGDLGGVAGADAKCAAEFPGFRFARNRSMLANLPGAAGPTAWWDPAGTGQWRTASAPLATLAAFTNGSWVNNPGSCSDWTSTSFSGTTTQYDRYANAWLSQSCATPMPLTCCNM